MMMTLWDESIETIMTLLGLPHNTGPGREGAFLELSYSSEFEPHGRASETWETVWRLKLAQIPRYRRHTELEWIKVGHGSALPEGFETAMTFKASTVQSVFDQAIEFLNWYTTANDGGNA